MKELTQTIDMLSQGHFLGIAYGEYLLAFLVLIVSLLISRFMHAIIAQVLRWSLSRQEQREEIIDALEKPLKILLLACGGFVILYILHLHGKPLEIASNMLKSVLIAVLFWCFVRVLLISESLVAKLELDIQTSVQEWLDMGIIILVSIFGAAIILDIWDIPIAPLIGSLGVLGIGVGLAARDLFTNLISGILIMSEKRFVPGEWIQVEGIVDGTVEKISFRSTLVRLFDSSPAYIPNGLLANNAMVNYSRMQNRRIYWMIGLEYTTPPETLVKIREDTEKWILNNPKMCSPQERTLFVRIDSFGSSEINLMVYCFTRSTVWGEWLQAKEEFALALIDIVKNAGSGFAFPSRTLYFGNPDKPEIFNPLQIQQDLVPDAAQANKPKAADQNSL